MVGRPMSPLVLSEDDVQQLQALANSRSLPHSIVQRAQIVLACGAGETNTAIAKWMGLTGMTFGKWRKRYLEQGLEGLHDELRPGRPRTYEDETEPGDQLIAREGAIRQQRDRPEPAQELLRLLQQGD
jgi:transposase